VPKVVAPTAPIDLHNPRANPPAKPMTKGERDDLQRLITRRERVLKSAAEHEAEQRIAQRCEALGIPAKFAPGVELHWSGRGQNAAQSVCT
jgi:hypothetical protein